MDGKWLKINITPCPDNFFLSNGNVFSSDVCVTFPFICERKKNKEEEEEE